MASAENESIKQFSILMQPHIRLFIHENDGDLECLDPNSTATSVATSVACPEETEIPEVIPAEKNIIKSQEMGYKRAIDCVKPSLWESGKQIRVSYPLQEAFKDNQSVSKEQGKGPFLPSEKQSVSKELILNTRQYLEMMMNYLYSATRDTSFEITPEMKAPLQLTTQLLLPKHSMETKEVELRLDFVEDTAPKHEKTEFICKNCADG
ncbi:hypothetical protein N7450_011712 [Penicillium hetheringtonii]|uniref:Uncharacterized protein n=1 Tax=Penicillium hetheringtonii TaxID=911720 RepID=A0AAD6GL73_9EURO|nr:hypothetical protein N7450_011712 [Penicillium hetheringtonii]